MRVLRIHPAAVTCQPLLLLVWPHHHPTVSSSFACHCFPSLSLLPLLAGTSPGLDNAASQDSVNADKAASQLVRVTSMLIAKVVTSFEDPAVPLNLHNAL